MGWILLVVFVVVPIVEIFGFLQVGEMIGLWPTMGIVILTAVAGSILLSHQGLETLMKAEQKLRAGELPMEQVVDGLCLAFAGGLLITPGFFTDAFGFLLFIPQFRRLFASFVFNNFISMRVSGYTTQSGPDPESNPGPGADFHDADGPIIDGTYEARDEPGDAKRPDFSNDNSKLKPPADKSSPWHDRSD